MAGLVVLVRHAEREFAPGVADAQQVLTAKGQQTAARLGERLAEKFAADAVEVGAIVSSPYARAVATAQIMAGVLAVPAERVAVWDELREEEDNTLIAPTLARLAQFLDTAPGAVLVIGHKPDLAELGWRLSGEEVQLRKAEAAAIAITDREPTLHGTVAWQLFYK